MEYAATISLLGVVYLTVAVALVKTAIALGLFVQDALALRDVNRGLTQMMNLRHQIDDLIAEERFEEIESVKTELKGAHSSFLDNYEHFLTVVDRTGQWSVYERYTDYVFGQIRETEYVLGLRKREEEECLI